jgi:hypothetical protein
MQQDYGARFDGFAIDGTTSDVGPLGYNLYKQGQPNRP